MASSACETCGKDEAVWPMAHRGMRWCSQDCRRKALAAVVAEVRGDLGALEAERPGGWADHEYWDDGAEVCCGLSPSRHPQPFPAEPGL